MTQSDRPIRRFHAGDGRIFFQFLLRFLGPTLPYDTIATLLLQTAQEHLEIERSELKGKNLKSWAEGTRIVPKWAYHAAYLKAMELGFSPNTADQTLACFTNWRQIHPDGPVDATLLEQFYQDHNVAPALHEAFEGLLKEVGHA